MPMRMLLKSWARPSRQRTDGFHLFSLLKLFFELFSPAHVPGYAMGYRPSHRVFQRGRGVGKGGQIHYCVSDFEMLGTNGSVSSYKPNDFSVAGRIGCPRFSEKPSSFLDIILIHNRGIMLTDKIIATVSQCSLDYGIDERKPTVFIQCVNDVR